MVMSTDDPNVQMAASVLAMSDIVDSVVHEMENTKVDSDDERLLNIIEAQSILCGIREHAIAEAKKSFIEQLTSKEVIEVLENYRLE